MRKKILFIAIILLISTTNVYANCQGSDGCKDCQGAALTECLKSNDYKSYQCKQGCNNVKDQTGYTTCIKSCEENPETGSSNFGNSNISGGSSVNSGVSQGKKPPVEYTETINVKVKDTKDGKDCESLFGTNTETGKMLHDAYNILKFVVPIIFLAMSIKDFGSGIISQNDSEIKKATSNFGKRLIIAILFLVLPTILNFFLKLLEIDTCFL